jgi:Right handed beta helix region
MLTNSTIDHNEISNMPYGGMGFGGEVAYPPQVANVVVRNNHVHDVLQILNDGGGIYVSFNYNYLVTENYVHNFHKTPLQIYTSRSVGVYFDNQTSQR